MTDQELGQNIEHALSRIYYNLASPTSYSSARKLLKKLKDDGYANVKLRHVEAWLRKQLSHTRHFRPRYVFPRRKLLFLRQNDTFAADLIEVSDLKSYNSGYCYILVVIDCFSKKVFLRKIKQKTTREMAEALRSIFEENKRSPISLWTDRGLGMCSDI